MNITVNTIEELLPAENRELVFRFFLVFSRFEYALKRAGFTITSRNSVQPSWGGFSSRYHPVFNPSQTSELRVACDYFIDNPPRKQILDGGNLAWSAPQFHTTKPLFIWLVLMVRSVRNNLFHGGKYPITPIQEPARNAELLQHTLTILHACLPLNSDVYNHYFSTGDS